VPQTNVIEIRPVLLFIYNTKNIAYDITEKLVLYADKIMVMGNSKNLRVFKENRENLTRNIYVLQKNIQDASQLSYTTFCWVIIPYKTGVLRLLPSTG